MGNYYRAQILLKPEQHRMLSELAKREGRSISDLVRESVQIYLVERDQEAQNERRMKALDVLTEIRERIQAEHGVLSGDFVAEMRKERDRDNDRVWRGEP
jgi:hypothetical protein